jgi:hypothetical protein
MEVLGILLSLFLLMFMAYMGFSVILFAPVFALLAAALQGLPIMPSYTELFMAKAVVYVKAFFPVFMLGAVFGKVMEDTLLAKGISHAIMEKLGHKHAVLAIVLSCAILTYGGVSLFVVVFAVYPFAAALFKEALDSRLCCLRCVHIHHGCLPWDTTNPEHYSYKLLRNYGLRCTDCGSDRWNADLHHRDGLSGMAKKNSRSKRRGIW